MEGKEFTCEITEAACRWTLTVCTTVCVSVGVLTSMLLHLRSVEIVFFVNSFVMSCFADPYFTNNLILMS